MHKFIFGLILVLVLVLPNFTGFAQDKAEERKLLETELQELEELIAKYATDITKTEQEKKTLQNQIYILRNKITKLNLQIKESNIMIKDIGFQIGDTEHSIDKTSLRIEDSKEKLIKILRTINEENQKSLIEVLLSEEEISSFYNNLIALEILNKKNKDLLKNIKSLKIYLEDQKGCLDEEKEDLERIVKIQTLQKQESQSTKNSQEYYLKLTEVEYQKSLKEKKETEKKAADIRARIFELIGVAKAPTFGEAVEIAEFVESFTGVEPALLLAILSQESGIGRNVGQCYLKNKKTGEGISIKTQKIMPRTMKPSRDVSPFLKITKELGRDPYATPVSCPMSFGYGGAMGPSQFIPSTWMIFKEQIAKSTGATADPWNIKHAFLATGLYIKDLGGASSNYWSQWRAAMKYFSGASWTKYEEFYGNQVMQKTKQFREDIKSINN